MRSGWPLANPVRELLTQRGSPVLRKTLKHATTTLLSLLILLLPTTPLPADLVPLGPAVDAGGQSVGASNRGLCAEAAGGYVSLLSEQSTGPWVQLFDASGAAVGLPFVAFTANGPGRAREIACFDTGGFIVTWTANGSSAFHEIYFQRFTGAGAKIGPETLVGDGDHGTSQQHALAVAPDGSFALAWNQNVPSGNEVAIRRFSPGGIPTTSEIGTEIPMYLNDDITAAIDPVSDALLIRCEREARGFDAAGTPLGPTVLVDVEYPGGLDLCFTPTGEALGVSIRNYYPGVKGQRLDTTGNPIGTEFAINTYTSGSHGAPVIDCLPTGDFIVAWAQDGDRFAQDGSGSGTFMRRLDALGAPLGQERAVNNYRRSNQVPAGISMQTDRIFVSYDGVVRMFCEDTDPTCIFRCAPGGSDTDTDGDGLPDECDPCLNLAGSAEITVKPKIALRTSNENDSGLTKMSFSGDVTIPGGFSSIDPASAPTRIVVGSQAGEIIDVVLPGGPPWSLNGPGTSWKYKDKTLAPIDGVTSIKITDRSAKEIDQVRFKVKAKGSRKFSIHVQYPLIPADVPPTATIVFGDDAAGAAGRCGETDFNAGDCKFSDTLVRRLSCKKK